LAAFTSTSDGIRVQANRPVALGAHCGSSHKNHVRHLAQGPEDRLISWPAEATRASVDGSGTVDAGDHVHHDPRSVIDAGSNIGGVQGNWIDLSDVLGQQLTHDATLGRRASDPRCRRVHGSGSVPVPVSASVPASVSGMGPAWYAMPVGSVENSAARPPEIHRVVPLSVHRAMSLCCVVGTSLRRGRRTVVRRSGDSAGRTPPWGRPLRLSYLAFAPQQTQSIEQQSIGGPGSIGTSIIDPPCSETLDAPLIRGFGKSWWQALTPVELL